MGAAQGVRRRSWGVRRGIQGSGCGCSPGYNRSLIYRLRRTALETPSLKRNQTSLLPTAVPVRRSVASVSGAPSPAEAAWLSLCLLQPPSPSRYTPA